MQKNPSENAVIIDNLINLLNKGNAHITLDEALKDIPFELLGKKPRGLPYSLWQIAEHIRIAQDDILKFSKDSRYQSPKWPEEYWPKELYPATEEEWKKCVSQIKRDRKSFVELLKNSADLLFIPFEYGNGQTLLREALVLADHHSYHTGEIIVLRRILNIWPK
jgi:uncharacterized damage-inducible protein DinB